ncbi:amidohydrolase [Ruegeria sp. PrR005]|uniref:Amidohydrolase n=1 Tax=Ruegeria sp. PrR005 TaxID=2706882 RepID=A0A6B2NSA1_9RHOB|nr:amidohydrolase [Ruegeria sp. PrR005]NDW44745.1 amidohydrolase [Ruegeria sp. PrR005]
MPVKNRFAELQDQIAEWRRDIHAHPEIRFEEHRTSALVAERLRAFGCDMVETGVGQTGVVGVIHGRESGSGRVMAFRADMDALPIAEATGLPHASTHAGKMHACGHDGHTAMLLGAAQYLAETRNFDGTVVLLFQPAEEGGGGAKAMLADGVMDRYGVSEVYGLHNWPGLPVGEFALREGPLMAATDFFEIRVQGRGGHGAMPHLTADATLAAAQLTVALQQVVARNVDPLKPAVLSVCSLRTDSDAHNVIADNALIKGTVRYLHPEVQSLIRSRIEAVATATAEAHGARAELNYMELVPATINPPTHMAYAAAAAQEVGGRIRTDIDPVMGGEDFADMLAERPGAFIFLGNGDSADLHHPAYEFNDAAIPAGCSWFATLAEQRMPLNP